LQRSPVAWRHAFDELNPLVYDNSHGVALSSKPYVALLGFKKLGGFTNTVTLFGQRLRGRRFLLAFQMPPHPILNTISPSAGGHLVSLASTWCG